MRMKSLLPLGCVFICCASVARQLPSQDKTLSPKPSADLRKFDAITSRMSAYLKALPAYSVKVTQRWQLDGDQPVQGVNSFLVKVRHPGHFRLEATSEGEVKGRLVCVSDGQRITRFFSFGPDTVYSRSKGDLTKMLDDAMTRGAVRDSGLDVIFHPDPHMFIMSSVSKVHFVGGEKLGDVKTEHYTMTWRNGSVLDVWFASGDVPVLLQTVRKLEYYAEADKKHVSVVTTKFDWQHGQSYGDETFRVKLPDDAIETRDLDTFLTEGGTIDMLGQKAPVVTLKTLDGSSQPIGKQPGSKVIVLYFWTTWAAASTQGLAELSKEMQAFQKQGVALQAINVAQPEKDVKAYLRKVKYVGDVFLDDKQKAARAYRVTSVPVIVLIGTDGTLQAVHVGSHFETHKLIQEDLARLLKGEKIVPVARSK